MLPEAKLDALVARYAAIETDLAGQPDRQTYVKLSREFADLGSAPHTPWQAHREIVQTVSAQFC